MKIHENGNATISVFVVMIALTLLVSLLVLLITSSLKKTSAFVDHEEARLQLHEKALLVLKEMQKDESPNSDSFLDQIFVQYSDDESVTIDDASSKFNPNFMQRNIIEKTTLKTTFINGHSFDDLKQLREETGLSLNIRMHYEDYFEEETFEKYFTPYGYVNINLDDADVMRSIFKYRVSETTGGDTFKTKIETARTEQKIITLEGLEEFLSPDYDKLFPIINSLPGINVNTAPEEVLEIILKYPYPEKPFNNADAVLESIVSLRKIEAISEEKLISLLGRKEDHRVYLFLGVKTWFWKITVTEEDDVFTLVAAILPKETADETEFEFQILEAYLN